MKYQIDNENSFKKAMKQGVNLFLGSGFSTLAYDLDHNNLPVGSELANELITLFGLPKGLDLGQACTILEATRKEELYDYLKRRFAVAGFDPRYMILEKVHVIKIFTTNIDDLVKKVYSESSKHYINDVSYRGASNFDKSAIDFIALHGSVTHPDKEMVFSSVDLASAFSNNSDDFRSLRDSVQTTPTLFWGYSFSDSSVIQALYPNLQSANYASRWIVLRKNDEASIQYFRALGMNIIISDTENLLEYIDEFISGEDDSEITESRNVYKFPEMRIPDPGTVTVRSLRNFYLGQAPLWSDIFSNRIHKTSHFGSVVNLIDSGEGVIVTGSPASGKTTLMMQIAYEYKFKNANKFVTNSISIDKVKMILKELNGESAIFFVDEVSKDIDAFNMLAEAPNVQVVGFDRDYMLEGISHKIQTGKYKIHNITDLNELDIQQIFLKIPEDIRKVKLRRAENNHPNQKISLFEFVEMNTTLPVVKHRVRSAIDQLAKVSKTLVEFFVMCCYCHACRTTVSFDMAYAFLRDDIKDYRDIYTTVETLGKLLVEDFNYIADAAQDYYSPRSSIFSEAIMDQVPSSILKDVFYKFHKNVSSFRVVNYHEFKRNAYDSKYFKKAFPDWEDGKRFYELIHETEGTPFILQQGALYLASKRRYTEAFKWIDIALSESKSKIFSIRNSHAIILFEANINQEDADQTVRQTLDESMSILKMCYEHDRRKMYHAIKFAEQSIEYYNKYGDGDAVMYLEVALDWLNQEERKADWNKKISSLKQVVLRLLN